MNIRTFTEDVVYKTPNILKADKTLLLINDSYVKCVTTAFPWPACFAHEPYNYLWNVWSHNNVGQILINITIS